LAGCGGSRFADLFGRPIEAGNPLTQRSGNWKVSVSVWPDPLSAFVLLVENPASIRKLHAEMWEIMGGRSGHAAHTKTKSIIKFIEAENTFSFELRALSCIVI